MEVGWGGLYTYRYNVTTRIIYALRWAAMRAILMFHNCEGQSYKTVSTDHYFWRERWAEADSNRGPFAYLPNARPAHTFMFIHWGYKTVPAVNWWHGVRPGLLWLDGSSSTAGGLFWFDISMKKGRKKKKKKKQQQKNNNIRYHFHRYTLLIEKGKEWLIKIRQDEGP